MHVCVSMLACLLGPTTYHKFQMSAFKYFTCEGQLRATVRVQRWGPGAKTTEVKTRVVLVFTSTNDGKPLTGGTNSICMEEGGEQRGEGMGWPEGKREGLTGSLQVYHCKKIEA